MKSKAILTLVVLCSHLTFITSQTNFWKNHQEQDTRNGGEERWVSPNKYRLLELDFDNLINAMRNSPLRTDNSAEGTLVSLPMPDGAFKDFLIFESPILATEMAAKFPTIKTFTGYGSSDPGTVVYMDITEKGFHGMILTAGNSIFIDPFYRDNQRIYACYNKQDYRKQADFHYSCETESDEVVLPSESMFTFDELRSAAVSLRTYDIAISATGEYTAFHGGTVEGATAGITTTLNRVRGIYETELAISFQLISNNENIIYTNAATDPYTAPPAFGANLTEVQATINSVIGSANYDIGHLFTTGSGGIATVGCVCNNSTKARGVSGLDYPLGDPFDVDFVAHEMGHQFDGNHTFNGTASSCSGNRTANSAYEPGSGSTIMSYAGICGSQNVQYTSNSYFHRKSLEKILSFVVDGSGNTCPSVTATANSTPTVDADPNSMNNKYIPANTPFELTASGSDPDGNNITYCWEQYDLGTAGAPAANRTTGPIFKSFSPKSSPTRTFPMLSNILDGSNGNAGEFLPSVSRALNFECTVRDNQSVGGGFAYDNITLNVDNSASAFAIANYNTSSVVQEDITLNWNVGNTTSSPVSCANVDVYLSTDGGHTFALLLAGTPNDGAQTVTLPNTATGTARIKVKCSDNVFFDINNADLRIAPANSTCAEKVTNGSFESGYTGWTSYSSNGYGLLGYFSETHEGIISALFGGGDNETSSMEQAINIPTDAHFASLTFWHKLLYFDCGADVFHVKVNGSVFQTIDICTTNGATDWEREIVDLSAYKGTTPTVKIELICNATNDTWVYLDDISLFVCEGGAFPLLPVEFIEFQAIASDNDAVLTWQTAQESDNKGFEIEMKNDAGVFSKIGFVQGAGTSFEPQSYRFVSPNHDAGIYYFRLRQIDENGHFIYSEVRTLVIGGSHQLSVYPNPANDQMNFEITQSSEQVLNLEIFNSTGLAIAKVTEVYAKGNFKIPFKTSELPTGIYFYHLLANSFAEKGRFVVKH